MTEVLDEARLDPEVLCAESILQNKTYAHRIVTLLGAGDVPGVAKYAMILATGDYDRQEMSRVLGEAQLIRIEGIIRELKQLDFHELYDLVCRLDEQIRVGDDLPEPNTTATGSRDRHLTEYNAGAIQTTLSLQTVAEGLCEQVDPGIRSGAGYIPPEYAKEICRLCDVRDPCLRYALDNGLEDGVWGGKTPGERRVIVAREKAITQLELALKRVDDLGSDSFSPEFLDAIACIEDCVRSVFGWRRSYILTVGQRLDCYFSMLSGESLASCSRRYRISDDILRRMMRVMRNAVTDKLDGLLEEVFILLVERQASPEYTRTVVEHHYAVGGMSGNSAG